MYEHDITPNCNVAIPCQHDARTNAVCQWMCISENAKMQPVCHTCIYIYNVGVTIPGKWSFVMKSGEFHVKSGGFHGIRQISYNHTCWLSHCTL